MKNTFLIALLFISVFANAQHGTASHQTMELDPWAIGLTMTPEQTKLSSNTGTFNGFTVGGQLGYFLNENMWLTTGVSYSRKGFKQNYNSLSSTTNPSGIVTQINYFEVPLYFSFRTGNFNSVVHKHVVTSHKKAGFIISAGPVAGILWDANNSSPGGHQIDQDALKSAGFKNTLGFMGSLGGYYQFSKEVFITLEPAYKITFTNVPKGSSHHWSSIGLTLNIWYRILANHPL
jgi:hypothetical protein